jgi:hypothetical protein
VDIVVFEMDLGTDEIRRRSEILNAWPDWDPAAQLAGEAQAYQLLYSQLDTEQEATHRALVAAGILPPEAGPRVPHRPDRGPEPEGLAPLPGV